MGLKIGKRGQGATEYLLMLAAVLVIVAVAIYYVTRAGGYPVVSMNAAVQGDNQIMITVLSGSIASGQWSYYVGTTPSTVNTTFLPGTGALAAPGVTLGTTWPKGQTYYVNIKHIGTGHIYFNPDQIVPL